MGRVEVPDPPFTAALGRTLSGQRNTGAPRLEAGRSPTLAVNRMSVDTVLGEVLAEREYEAIHADGREPSKVVLRIGKPRTAPHLDGAWVCPIQILGIGDDDVVEAAGIDAVQALHLGMAMAGARLTNPPKGLKITWLGGSDLDLPLADPAAAAFDFGEGDAEI